MEILGNVLDTLEGGFDLGWLVSVGDFYAGLCADMAGDWVRDAATNTYACVNTNLDDWIGDLIRDI